MSKNDDLVRRLRSHDKYFLPGSLADEAATAIERGAQSQVAVTDELAKLRDACNQSRLAFSGMVSVQSAIDKLDALTATPPAPQAADTRPGAANGSLRGERQALATPPAPAPDAGDEWKLVPREMTADMINAWSGGLTVTADTIARRTPFQEAWSRVIAAAPSPTPQPPAVEAEVQRYLISYDTRGEIPHPSGDFVHIGDHKAALKAKTDEIERLRRERDAARQALEHDRSKAITACNEFSDAFKRRSWLLESRGSYEWDDDRYRDEFRQAYDEMVEPINRLREIGRDWSNCPTDHEEIMRARIALDDLMNDARAWRKRMEAAEASNKALRDGLEPFSKHAENSHWWDTGGINRDDLRRARALLSETGGADV